MSAFSKPVDELDERQPLCVCSPQFTATTQLVPLLIFYGTRAVVLSLLCAHTVSHSPIWKRNTQSPWGSGGKRETSGCRPVFLIICAGFLGPLSQIREISLSPEWDKLKLWRGKGDPSHLSKLGHAVGLYPNRQYHLKKGNYRWIMNVRMERRIVFAGYFWLEGKALSRACHLAGRSPLMFLQNTRCVGYITKKLQMPH